MCVTLLSLLLMMANYAMGHNLPKPPSGLQDILDMTKLSLTSGLLGSILIYAGLLMCFVGKRFFKLFLSVVGMAGGSIIGFIIMAHVRDWGVAIPNEVTITYVVAGIMGLVVAAVCLYVWKIGVYVGAGLGGYALITYILSLQVGGIIENQIGRQGALVIGVALGLLAAMFLEDLAISIASSFAGALSTMYGLDCFLNTGFRAQIYDQAIKRTFIIPTMTGEMYMMFAGTLGLAVLGVVVQLLSSSSKGYGRGY